MSSPTQTHALFGIYVTISVVALHVVTEFFFYSSSCCMMALLKLLDMYTCSISLGCSMIPNSFKYNAEKEIVRHAGLSMDQGRAQTIL